MRLCAIILMLLACAVVRAAEPSGGGGMQLVRRVVHVFDFEERQRGNFERMPMHWFRVNGPGFPNYTDIGFDAPAPAPAPGTPGTPGTPGIPGTPANHSFKLELNGGSAAAVLEPGVIPAVPDAEYLVGGRVRTAAAEHSRVRMVGVFVDQQRQLIEHSVTTSPLALANDGWASIQLNMPPAPAEAAWLILRVELLQPLMYRTEAVGVHELLEQDLRATAWFDDITIFQLPRVRLRTQHLTNVIRRPELPMLHAGVEDFTGQQLTADLTIRDHAGRIIDHLRRPLQPAAPSQWQWEPKLPRLGWYWAQLEVSAAEGVVAEATLALLWLPPRTGGPESEWERFMLTAEQRGPAETRLLPPLLDQLGPQSVLLSIWRDGMTREQLLQSVQHADPLVHELLGRGREVTLSIHSIPRELAQAAAIDRQRPMDLFAATPTTWQDHLNALLALYGHAVHEWHVGGIDSAEATHHDDVAALYGEIAPHFRRYIADAGVTLPWPGLHQLPGNAAAAPGMPMIVHIPTSIRPPYIEDYAKTWAKPAEPSDTPSSLTYLLDTLEPGLYAHEDRATDLALRMIYAWRTQPRRLAIAQPWSTRSGDAGAPDDAVSSDSASATIDAAHAPRLVPDPLLGVWSNVAAQLAGRRFVGELNLGEGIRAVLLDNSAGAGGAVAAGSGGGAAGGIMIVWTEGLTQSPAIDLYLGPQPHATDVHGNREPLPVVGELHRLHLSQSPVFIDGIDMALALVRAGLEVAPTFIPSMHAVHQHELTLQNPFPRTITGKLRFVGPERWEIQPRVHAFTIPAGGEMKLPIFFTFPANELAGQKLLTAEVEFDADDHYRLQLSAPVMVGLNGVHLQSAVAVEGEDLLITLMVTNTAEREQSFYAFALAPGLPRQERIVASLKPTETVSKRFRFPGAAKQLSQQQIRVGLRQTDGPAMLNHIVTPP